MSGDPQKDALDENLLLLLCLSSWLMMTVGLSLLGLQSMSKFCFSVDDTDLITLGILASLVEIDLFVWRPSGFLTWPPGSFLLILADLLSPWSDFKLMILYKMFLFKYDDVFDLKWRFDLHDEVLDLIQDGCYWVDEVLVLMKLSQAGRNWWN